MKKINTIIEKVEYTISELPLLKEAIKAYKYLLLIKTDKVELVSTLSDFNLDNLKDLRAFNEKQELHLAKISDKFIGRIRKDTEGEICEVYDEQHLLWGKAVKTDNGVTEFFEDRGIILSLPIVANEGERAVLKVRSYLSDEKFEFTDFRLMDIMAKEVCEYGTK